MSTLKGFESAWVRLQPLRAVAPLFLAQVVSTRRVRIQQDLIPEVSTEQFRHRLVEDLAGQIPERHIDPAEHFDLTPALRVGVKHVMEMHLDGERILAD